MLDTPISVWNSFWAKHPEFIKEKSTYKPLCKYSKECVFAYAVFLNDLFNNCIISSFTNINSSLEYKEALKLS